MSLRAWNAKVLGETHLAPARTLRPKHQLSSLPVNEEWISRECVNADDRLNLCAYEGAQNVRVEWELCSRTSSAEETTIILRKLRLW